MSFYPTYKPFGNTRNKSERAKRLKDIGINTMLIQEWLNRIATPPTDFNAPSNYEVIAMEIFTYLVSVGQAKVPSKFPMHFNAYMTSFNIMSFDRNGHGTIDCKLEMHRHTSTVTEIQPYNIRFYFRPDFDSRTFFK